MRKQHYSSVKLINVGDISVGKSGLNNTYVYGVMDYPHHHRFVPIFVKKLITIDDITLNLDIWDTGGQEKFNAFNISYYRTNGVMLVYDITNRDSFDNLRDSWYKEVRRYSEKHTQCILVGNKCDLESKRAVESSTGKEFADSLNIPFIETSAKENINVEQAFVLLAAMIVKKLPEVESERKDIILLDGERRETNNSRCYC
ncbi:Ras-related protein Rab-1A [Oopsacas minuta]|uniref:Ras-related protein Rab-1A n=1 Tax=Oopsacas minuta TaxID=111878 RepID=A0AAV7K4D8_9METZ|nr:Ras-related protein Rab-1A [Oopsacas minuta]